MSHSKTRSSEFVLEGVFLGFAAEKGYKLKLLRLSTATGEQIVKLPKELRPLLYRSLMPGMAVRVMGSQKWNSEAGCFKLKAYQVSPLGLADMPQQSSKQGQPQAAEPAKACILVCQKSDCCKRGGRALTAALQQELDDRGLADQVKIKGTGCMKRCKAGPNLVMPDKTRYSNLRASDVPALIDEHFETAPINQSPAEGLPIDELVAAR